MNKLEFNQSDAIVAMTILNESQRLVEYNNAGVPISVDQAESIPLEDLQEVFEVYGDDFMSDELLEAKLDYFKQNFRNLREKYPKGCKLLLGAFPCENDGTMYTPEEIKQGECLTILYVDPETGLSSGYGSERLNTFAKLLPKEIRDACSFEPQYQIPNITHVTKEDGEAFAKQYKEAYKALRKILKGE
ncbi:hypothetical protein ACFL3T_02065 [Patescibacteria group bacterium]